MVLSGRAQPSRRVGALRARGLLLEIAPDELRMGEEARAPCSPPPTLRFPTPACPTTFSERRGGPPASIWLRSRSGPGVESR